MTVTSPDFDELNDALGRAAAEMDIAEAHGLLCGLLSAGPAASLEQWLTQVLPASEAGDALHAQTTAELKKLYQQTIQALQGENFELFLMLPDDESVMAVRQEALGHWCQGFLLGLSAAGIKDTDALPGELPEIVRDFVEIARAESYESGDEDEEDEAAYAELVEYIRVSVQLFMTEMAHLHQQHEQPEPRLH